MIKVGVREADTPQAGELIRILAGHPEVTLLGLEAVNLDGIPVASHHHGLIGETDLVFRSNIDLSRCDLLFICSTKTDFGEIKDLQAKYPDMRIIVFGDDDNTLRDNGFTLGLSELNRKAIVRGGKYAYLPHPFTTMASVSLFPLAAHLLLNGDIRITVYGPEDVVRTSDVGNIISEIETILQGIQKGFVGKVDIDLHVSPTRRTGLVEIEIDTSVKLDHLREMYDMYDDHRFSFPVLHPVGVSEVAGTNKCVISLSKVSPEKTKISCTADCRLRGGAGEAVHVMNLMFGLHEKTGLSLKATDFYPIDSKKNENIQSEND